ncbi:MAG: hypothetical protein LBF15_05805 [Candidatus Peribacteria bacterium]|nr:hypothetical protein [Candidatus Peribacteria bacterium]
MSLNFSKIEEIYLEMMKLEKKDRKNKETEFKKEKENLRKNLVKYFDDYGEILKNSLE